MTYYDFSTLNSSDLEDLFCDLLNAAELEKKTDKVFCTFKEGKDQGVDILQSTIENDHECIGQVKHYYRTGLSGLLTVLEKEEVTKIRKLNPSRYLLATSVDLNRKDKIKIKEIFKPYIQNLTDIYGLKDLNRNLNAYPEVLNKHFKLWFSGTNVLRKILQYEFDGRSQEFAEHELKRRVRLYIKTEFYEKAKESLQREKFVIITGEPGSGKTSLAQLLLYEYIGKDYELTYLLDIEEVGKKIKNDDSKQIFYYDDFLGHNALEIEKAKASEKHLVQTLMRIRDSKNKLFIFTTRTFILKDAVAGSEKLSRLNLLAKQNTLLLEEYDEILKSNMLDNHVEESELPEEHKAVFRGKHIRDFIINHDNFYPRSVEFITSAEYLKDKSPGEFESYIYENFNSPDEIWRHAYTQQIKDVDRFLINTMLSFGNSVLIKQLENAFEARIDYEVKYNNTSRPFNAFSTSFQRLLGGFIIYEYFEDNKYVKFINPSLVDFLLRFLREDKAEVFRIAESAIYPHQLTRRLFPIPRKDESAAIPQRLINRLVDDCSGFLLKEDTDLCRMAMVMLCYNNTASIHPVVNNCLLKIKDWLYLFPETDSTDTLALLLSEMIEFPKTDVIKIGVSIYAPIIVFLYDFQEILKTKEEMNRLYGFVFEDLFSLFQEYEWEEYFNEVLNCYITDIIENFNVETYSSNLVDSSLRKISEFREIVISWGFESHPDIQRLRDFEQNMDDISHFKIQNRRYMDGDFISED